MRRAFFGAVGGFGGCGVFAFSAQAEERPRTVEEALSGYEGDSKLETKLTNFSNENRWGTAYRRGTLTEEYPDTSLHFNYMSSLLDKATYAALVEKRTSKGFTLERSIQPGLDVGSPLQPAIGCFAGDEESYYAFSQLYNKIAAARHGWENSYQHSSDLNPNNLRDTNLNPQFVVGVRVRMSRNLAEHRFAPAIKRAERREVEFSVLDACRYLSGNLQGRYYKLDQISKKEHEDLVSAGVGFDKPTSEMVLSGRCARDWPDARGIYVNKTRSFALWINEMDHVRVIAQQKGGNVGEAFSRAVTAMADLEYALRENLDKTFCCHSSLGFLGPSLANLGSGMRVTMTAKFPKLSQHPQWTKFLEQNELDCTQDPAVGTVALTNHRRMMKTEVQILQRMVDAVNRMIIYEKSLQEGRSVPMLL